MNEKTQKQFMEFMEELANSPEAIKDSQEREQRIKELVNKFVNNSYEHVFPRGVFTELDQKIKKVNND
jgi:hypothetical protein